MQSFSEEEVPKQYGYNHGVSKFRYAGMASIVLVLCCGSFWAGARTQYHQIASGANPGAIKDLIAKFSSGTGKLTGTMSLAQLEKRAQQRQLQAGGKCFDFWKKMIPYMLTEISTVMLCHFEQEAKVPAEDGMCGFFQKVAESMKTDMGTCKPGEKSCTVSSADNGVTDEEAICVPTACVQDFKDEMQHVKEEAKTLAPPDFAAPEETITCK